MTGRMIDFDAGGSRAPGYLATPDAATGPGVVVLHEWWGLTGPMRQACDRLAAAGFMALAPDLYRGKTTASIEEAEALGAALDQRVEQWRGDIRGALRYLRQYGVSGPAGGRDALGFVAFSLGGSYALDMSIHLGDEIAAVATFYATYPGLDYRGAKAAYLCHFAEDDPFVSAAEVAEMERRWSRRSRSRGGQPLSIPIQTPGIGSLMPIARMPMMPPRLPSRGSGPSPS